MFHSNYNVKTIINLFMDWGYWTMWMAYGCQRRMAPTTRTRTLQTRGSTIGAHGSSGEIISNIESRFLFLKKGSSVLGCLFEKLLFLSRKD